MPWLPVLSSSTCRSTAAAAAVISSRGSNRSISSKALVQFIRPVSVRTHLPFPFLSSSLFVSCFLPARELPVRCLCRFNLVWCGLIVTLVYFVCFLSTEYLPFFFGEGAAAAAVASSISSSSSATPSRQSCGAVQRPSSTGYHHHHASNHQPAAAQPPFFSFSIIVRRGKELLLIVSSQQQQRE